MGVVAAIEARRKYNALAERKGWASICDETLAFNRLELRAVLNLWRGLACADRLPSRKDVTPRVLKSLLRNVAIYERVANGSVRYRVRVMGTAFTDVMGDIGGKYLDEAIPLEFLPRWHAALDAPLDSLAPLRFVACSHAAERNFLVGEYFEAPLMNDEGHPTMIMTAGLFAPRKWTDIEATAAVRPAQPAAHGAPILAAV